MLCRARNESSEEEEEEDDEVELKRRARSYGECCSPQADDSADVPHFSREGLLEGPLSHDGSPHVTDEVFNAASHLFGGILSILGTAVLVTGASNAGNPWAIVAFSLYGASLIFLFFASFAHHAIKGSQRLMRVLRTLDYVAIYLLIPGTMMPVCLVCLHKTWVGWVFFGTTIGIAIMGVMFQTLCSGKLEWPMWASMTMYITLGWFGAFLAIPAMNCIGTGGALLLLYGGLAYTGGGVIFTLQCPNPVPGKFGFHEIWHVFVLAGAGFHWCAIFFHVWPAMLQQ